MGYASVPSYTCFALFLRCFMNQRKARPSGPSSPVQAKASSGSSGPTQSATGSNAQAIAKAGTQGGETTYPFLDAIQASFGDHDISDISAHTGPAAEQANDQLGANAFATGSSVAFGAAPDLHTAAHEAAHVVQQQHGVSLSSDMGQAGDVYEQHADAVADAVVSGQSAETLLSEGPSSGVASSSGSAVQLDEKEQKEVSPKAMARISQAQDAIKHTKTVLEHGAGNQVDALQDTNFNSFWRLLVMRHSACWRFTSEEAVDYASRYPEALTAAKADLAQGGNCGEHAAVAFDYLRANGGGETLNRVGHSMDHAFVLIGDLDKEGGDEIVACDPWPTKPTACLFEDHFCYTTDPEKLTVSNTLDANGAEVKAIIASGLELSDMGQELVEYANTQEETDKALKDKKNPAGPFGIEEGQWDLSTWDHANTATTDYDYVVAGDDASRTTH